MIHSWRSVSPHRRSVYGWILWSAGVLAFPFGGLLVPHGKDYVALAIEVTGSRGIFFCIILGIAFVLMFTGMMILRSTSLKHAVVAQIVGSLIVAALTLAIPVADPY